MFFDNASTTIIDDEIVKGFKTINSDYYYNPGGLYSKGRQTKNFLDEQRKLILSSLNGDGRLVFTGSATEANNLAILGCVRKNFRKILVSVGEHPSVYNVAIELKNMGYNVEFIKLDKTGKVDISDFENKMTNDVDFVSIMHVSNETGAINDIANLVYIAKSKNPNVIFHSDGVQAVGKIAVDLDDLGVDMYTMSAHKIHGMKGVGALFVRNNIKLKPIIYGGGQEDGLRSGTENILGIFSLSRSVTRAISNQSANYKHIIELKNCLLNRLGSSQLNYKINSSDDCSPYIISVSFNGCRAETILNLLNDRGVYVGNGSACSSKKSGNRILEAMGMEKCDIEGNLRISFSKYNTIDEVNLLADNLIKVVSEYLYKVR